MDDHPRVDAQLNALRLNARLDRVPVGLAARAEEERLVHQRGTQEGIGDERPRRAVDGVHQHVEQRRELLRGDGGGSQCHLGDPVDPDGVQRF